MQMQAAAGLLFIPITSSPIQSQPNMAPEPLQASDRDKVRTRKSNIKAKGSLILLYVRLTRAGKVAGTEWSKLYHWPVSML